MKIKIIIEDVDVTVAQLLGLLGDNATVEIEQPLIKETVEKTVKVAKMKETETSKEVKKSKKRTCKYCGKQFTYKKSHKKCQTRCKAKMTPQINTKAKDKKEKVKPIKAKSKPKFTRPAPKIPKPKKSKPKYQRLSDNDLKEMVASFLLGNTNSIVTSSQITATYVTSVKSKYEMSPAAMKDLSNFENRVISVMKAAAKIMGINHCMAMDLEPNGLQIAVFDKVGITVAKLKKQL